MIEITRVPSDVPYESALSLYCEACRWGTPKVSLTKENGEMTYGNT